MELEASTWMYDTVFGAETIDDIYGGRLKPVDVTGKAALLPMYHKDLAEPVPPAVAADPAAMTDEDDARRELAAARDGVVEVTGELGGWRAVVYRSDGTVDLRVPLDAWPDPDKVRVPPYSPSLVTAPSHRTSTPHLAACHHAGGGGAGVHPQRDAARPPARAGRGAQGAARRGARAQGLFGAATHAGPAPAQEGPRPAPPRPGAPPGRERGLPRVTHRHQRLQVRTAPCAQRHHHHVAPTPPLTHVPLAAVASRRVHGVFSGV